MNTHSNPAERGQVVESAAEVYDRFFVPALFGQFAPELCRAAPVGPGDRVLDLACGTGAVALAAHDLGADVTGCDVNPGMLAVARAKSDVIDWTEGAAEALPFDDAVFDIVTCQFALMFFQDRSRALAEIARVLKPGGRLALSTWGPVADTPGYRDLIPLIRDIGGDAAADALTAPFTLGDAQAVLAILADAGFSQAFCENVTGTARFPGIRDWIETEIGGWTLSEMFDAPRLERLIARAKTNLSGYRRVDGRVAFAAPALFFIAAKPE